MNRPNVLIAGGGFAGLWAARTLDRLNVADVTLLDRRATSDFLPLLPDVAGGRVSAAAARWPLAEAAGRFHFRFIQDELIGVDLKARRAFGRLAEYPYDYVLLACGSEPNFFGRHDLRPKMAVLNSVEDAIRLGAALDAMAPETTVVVVGGGYTGIEIATHAQRRLQARNLKADILILEATPELLGTLPERVRRYACRNLDSRGIRVMLNATLKAVQDDGVMILSDGARIPRSLSIWSAGVCTGAWRSGLALPADRQGRLQVDRCLRVSDCCFAAGDTASYPVDGRPLRMGVQFALTQGICAARNIAAFCRARSPRPYRPWDPGFIVPLANRRGCGQVLGLPVSGRPASWLHYLLCAYRSWTWANRRALLHDIISAEPRHP